MIIFSPERAKLAAAISLELARARGVTWSGHEFWTDDEDAILRAYHPDIKAAQRQLGPRRTRPACHYRAQKLGLTAPRRHWTTQELKTLRKVYPFEDRDVVLLALPGRNWEAIGAQAVRCKLHRPRRPPVTCGVDLIDTVRARAFDDDIRFCHLDREIGGKHFSRYFRKKRPNFHSVYRAVEFFGGRLVIDWMDE